MFGSNRAWLNNVSQGEPKRVIRQLRPSHQSGLTAEVQHPKQAMLSSKTFHSAPQPNCTLHADAKTGHAFGIFMASFCALRPYGLRRR
jgi:hypothetical protein